VQYINRASCADKSGRLRALVASRLNLRGILSCKRTGESVES
jgi:hypothetical protein